MNAANVILPFLIKTDRKLTEHEEALFTDGRLEVPVRIQGGVAVTNAYRFSINDMKTYPYIISPDVVISEVLCHTTLRRLRFLFNVDKNLAYPPGVERLAPPAFKRLCNISSAMTGYPLPSLLSIKLMFQPHGLGAPFAVGTVASNELVHPGRKVGSMGTMVKAVLHTVLRKGGYTSFHIPNMVLKIFHILSVQCGVKATGSESILLNEEGVLQELKVYWNVQDLSRQDVQYLVKMLLEGKNVAQWVDTLRKGYSVDEFIDGLPSYTTKKKTVHYVSQVNPPSVRGLLLQYEQLLAAFGNNILEIHEKLKTKGETADQLHRRSVRTLMQTIVTHVLYCALERCIEEDEPIVNKDHFMLHSDGFSFIKRPNCQLNVDEIKDKLDEWVVSSCGNAFQMVKFREMVLTDVIEQCLDDEYYLWNAESFLTDQPGRVYMGQGSIDEMHFREEALHHAATYNTMLTWFEKTHIYAVETSTYYKFMRNAAGSIVELEKLGSGELKGKYEALKYWETKRKRDGTEVEEMEEFTGRYTKDAYKKQYASAGDYPPPALIPPDTFNTWIVSPYHDCVISPGKDRPEIFNRFIAQLGAACSECEVSVKIQLVFLADMIQRPGIKPGIALIYHGGEGTGKSFLGQYFMQLVGKHRSVAARACDALTTFNSIIDGKLLILFDEILAGKEATAEINNQLKSIITDKEMSINEKHKKQRQTRSYHRIVATTNEPHVMLSKRRPCYFKSNLSLRVNSALASQLYNDMEDVDGLRFIYNFLQHYDIAGSGIDIHNPPTDAYNREVSESRDPTLLFVKHLVLERYKDEPRFFISIFEQHQFYTAWAENERNNRTVFAHPGATDQQIMKHSWTMSDASNSAISDQCVHNGKMGRWYTKDTVLLVLSIIS